MSTRIVSFLLVFILLFSSVTSVYGMDNGFIDMPDENHWSYNALKSAIDNGLLKGYNNKITPEGKATRAQIAAVINSAFGAIDTADISRFTDVSEKAWYYKDMSMAFRMGTFVGTGNKLLPLKNATRQEVFCVIAHALKLSSTNIEALDRFSDKDDTATWAKESLAALAENNYISGFNGKLNPSSEITRAELVQIMHNTIKSYITSAGTYTFSAEGNVMVNCPNVVIKDCIIKGDLILDDGVGNGDITLDNTKIEGRLLARGGGQNTILIKNNSAVGNVIISKTGSGAIRIKTEGNVQIEHVYVDDGKDDVILEGIFNQIIVETDTPVVVKDATVSSVNVKAAGAYISIEGKTTISSVNFNKTAQDSFIFIADGATVRNMLINAQNVKVIGWKNTNSSNPQSPAKAPLSVTSISAINANQIQVVFNKELNEASAKDISFYEIKDKGTKIITLTAGAVTLTNPKTAVITLSDSNRLTYNTTAKVTVKRGIKALDGTELASDITSNVKVEELIAPTCISCEVTGEKTLKLSFSKPVCDGTNNSFLNI